MNELFVNIKVDREERPDIDQIYMNALHLLGEQGGWPLTMFLTPAGEPVWGGTYFPKEARYGRAAFTDVLREIARLFAEEPDRIGKNRDALMARLAEKARPAGKVVVGLPELDRVANGIARAIDTTHGGLRGAPKFPQCALFELLWRAGERAPAEEGATRTAAPAFFGRVLLTLEHISEGGITITSAAASRAIRSTSAGSCRTSRRCCTTTRSSSNCWRSRMPAPGTRCSASAPPRRSAGSRAR